MLQMAHQRYELLGAEQWNHSEKWDKYCPVCKAKKELEQRIQLSTSK